MREAAKASQILQLLKFFNRKYWRIWDSNVWSLNETLINDVVSFEQPGPDFCLEYMFVQLEGTMTLFDFTAGPVYYFQVAKYVSAN